MKETWNPAEISEDNKPFNYVNADSWNAAELNEAINLFGVKYPVDTWNPAELDEKSRNIINDITSTKTVTGNPILLKTINGGYAKSCEVTMNPIQDLHGQSAPYPAGGGKNKLIYGGSTQTIDNVTFTVNDDGTITVVGTGTTSGSKTKYLNIDTTKIYGDFLLIDSGNNDTNNRDLFIWNTTTSARVKQWDGTTASLSSRGDFVQVKIPQGDACLITLRVADNVSSANFTFKPMLCVAGTTDKTYSPYSNICPISGRDSLSLTRTGKNLADFVNGKGIDNDGSITDSTGRIATVNPIVIQSGSSYVFKQFSTTESRGILAVFNGSTLVRRTSNIYPNTTLDTSGGDKFYFCVYSDVTVESAKAMIILSTSTATAYEPYHGETHTATFPNTVYGGKVVWKDGVVKAVIDKASIDLSALTYTYDSEYTRFVSSAISGIKKIQNARLLPMLCSCYKVVDDGRPIEEVTNFSIYKSGGLNNETVNINDYRYTEPSDLVANLSGQNLVYPLATPQEITLTPDEIELLSGINVLWTDGDSIELKYTKLALPDDSEGLSLNQKVRKAIEIIKGKAINEEIKKEETKKSTTKGRRKKS